MILAVQVVALPSIVGNLILVLRLGSGIDMNLLSFRKHYPHSIFLQDLCCIRTLLHRRLANQSSQKAAIQSPKSQLSRH